MAKKKHHEEHENHERWLVSYADFVTLLFATFTALYAMSARDSAKAKEFQKSIQKAFRSFVDFGGVTGKFVINKLSSDSTKIYKTSKCFLNRFLKLFCFSTITGRHSIKGRECSK